jgi:hypothetical protein
MKMFPSNQGIKGRLLLLICGRGQRNPEKGPWCGQSRRSVSLFEKRRNNPISVSCFPSAFDPSLEFLKESIPSIKR